MKLELGKREIPEARAPDEKTRTGLLPSRKYRKNL
jgi:hypothetical protein